MRQIGTLPDGDAARRLADYLLTLKIETRLEQQPDGWGVWVCDEDRVPQAREVLAEFQREPSAARFAGAARTAQQLRLRELEEEEDYRQRMTAFRERMSEPPSTALPVTTFLLAAAVLVTLLTNFGQPPDKGYLPAVGLSTSRFAEFTQAAQRYLWISSAPGAQLTQIAHGEVWRLVTPIFLHFNFMHLLFNCLAIYYLAGQVERQQGAARLLWLVFVFAVFSNLTQFYLGHPFEARVGFGWWHSPYFGGLSGVAYGVFGYVWMRSRLEPQSGYQMTSLSVLIMMGWFVACFTGLLGSVANAAHSAGLALGLVFGVAPQVWQRLRQR